MSFFVAIRYAVTGIKVFVKTERNGQIQLGISVLVILLGFILKIERTEWIAILFCIMLVIGFEMINTAIENLCNLVHSDYHPRIKIIKDLSAGAVLMAAILSAIIGTVIFFPRIMTLF